MSMAREPGDTLEITILKKIRAPMPTASNFQRPGKDFPTVGQLAPISFPRRLRPLLQAAPGKMQTRFKPGKLVH